MRPPMLIIVTSRLLFPNAESGFAFVLAAQRAEFRDGSRSLHPVARGRTSTVLFDFFLAGLA
jgi:hypothetical protein